MKYILVFIITIISTQVTAQKFYTKTGLTEFKASEESFEPVEAKNNSTTAILDTSTGTFATLIFVNAFQFKIALMQEHFNENYMDSEKFPKATFKGKIKDFDSLLRGEETEGLISGTITIKGVSKAIEAPISLIKTENNTYQLSSSFILEPKNFNIEIPKLVRHKIAKTVVVNLNYELHEKK